MGAFPPVWSLGKTWTTGSPLRGLTSPGCHGFSPQVGAETIFTRPGRLEAPMRRWDGPQAEFGGSASSPRLHPTGAALPAGNLERRNRVDMQ